MKIPNFPVPVVNETYASTIARHLARTAGSKARHLRHLSLWHSQPNTVAPHNSQNFCALMPNGHPWADNPEYLINHNTLVPMCLYFAPKSRREKAVTEISSNLSHPNSMLGLSVMAGRSIRPPLNAKHCSLCIQNDLDIFGFSVAYRQHQPSFVKICTIHNQILSSNCLNCFPNKPSEFWRMAGVCSCKIPNTPSVLNECSPSDFESWLWLARQVDYILADRSTKQDDHRLHLDLALRERGFQLPNGHIDRKKIDLEIIDKFGYGILDELDMLSDPSKESSKILKFSKSSKANTANYIPNAVQMLLLTRAARNSILDLEERPAPMISPAQAVSLTYVPRTHLTCLTEQIIREALRKNNYKIEPTATSLNITSRKLRGELIHFQISLPISTQIINKIGEDKLCKTLALLKNGYDRVHISKKLEISIYTVESIELANPGLHCNRHLARFARHQTTYRTKYLRLCAQHPSTSLNELRKKSRTCVAWLERYDKAWLQQQPRGKGRPRLAKVNLAKRERMDSISTERIITTAREELSRLTRPIKLSKTRLLLAGKISRNYNSEKMLARFPNAFAAAELHAESKDMFYKRLIKWTLTEHKKTGKDLSQYTLSRLTSISPSNIKQLKVFILDLAQELGIHVATGSILN